MRNNETGEFELVVGNKQLLSGFFIVVLLFAVAFAMGYVVGQNTQRPVRLASEGGSASNAANTAAADSRPQPASPGTPVPVSSTPPAPDGATGTRPQPASPLTRVPVSSTPPPPHIAAGQHPPPDAVPGPHPAPGAWTKREPVS